MGLLTDLFLATDEELDRVVTVGRRPRHCSTNTVRRPRRIRLPE